MKFNKESLELFCKEHNLKIKDTSEKVSRRVKLQFICQICKEISLRSFEQLYNQGNICSSCVMKKKAEKISKKLSASASIKDTNKNEYIIRKLSELFEGLDYDYSKVNWNGKMGNSKITIICKKHSHEWTADIRNLLNGHGCKLCGTEKTSNKMKKDFISESKQIFGEGRFDYSKVNYKNAHQTITLKCIDHNEEFNVIAREHLIAISGGCPSCYKVNRSGINHTLAISLEELQKRIQNIWGEEYLYDLSSYTHLNSYIIITCKKHNFTWKSTASNHLSPRGCRKCGLESTAESRRMPQEEFIKRVTLLHGNKYDYTHVNYVNNSTRVKILCKKHGEFQIVPSMHLDGYGCPSCSKGGVSKGQIEWLDNIQSKIEYDIIYKGGKYNREETFRLNNKIYRTDGYCKDSNTVYEFLGCWYHGCPKCYNNDKIHSWKKLPMKDLFEEFMNRKNTFENNGYKMIHIWECEWNLEKCHYRIQYGDETQSEGEEIDQGGDMSGCLILDDA